MLYPIMPIYLKSIGFSIVLGILEGVAEATAGLSKAISENVRCDCERVPFVQQVIAFSAISNP
jgi:hypothetical protein